MTTPHMKALKSLLVSLTLAAAEWMPCHSMQRVEISGYTDSLNIIMSVPNRCYVISGEIALPAKSTVTVGQGSLLLFRGGNFKGGEVNVNGAYIDAAGYCIFDGTRVSGGIGNTEISGTWFGRYGDDAGPALQLALSASDGNVVTAGKGEIKVISTVALDRDGQRLRAEGRVRASACPNAVFTLSGENQEFTAGDILESVSQGGKTIYGPAAAVSLFSSRSSKVDVRRVYMARTGVRFLSAGNSNSSSSTAFNRLNFKFLYADTAMTADMYSTKRPGNMYGNWIQGGRLLGNHGFWQYGSRRKGTSGEEYASFSNTYYSIGFEEIEKNGLHVRNARNEDFRYSRMNESLPAGNYADYADCRDIHLQIKGFVDPRNFHGAGQVYNFSIEGINNQFGQGNSYGEDVLTAWTATEGVMQLASTRTLPVNIQSQYNVSAGKSANIWVNALSRTEYGGAVLDAAVSNINVAQGSNLVINYGTLSHLNVPCMTPLLLIINEGGNGASVEWKYEYGTQHLSAGVYLLSTVCYTWRQYLSRLVKLF